MNEEAGCTVVIAGVILLAFLAAGAYENGYDKGRRDAECRAAFALAATASDSLVVSRRDERCARMIQEAP